MGWSLIDGKQTYLTPDGSGNTSGMIATPPEVVLEHHLRDYGLVVARRDAPAAPGTVEALGYSLADALYWVDDYKTNYRLCARRNIQKCYAMRLHITCPSQRFRAE